MAPRAVILTRHGSVIKVKTIFIVGPPRSGTTLLSYLVAGGDRVLSLSEPFLAHAIYSRWRLRWFFVRVRRSGGLHPVRVPRNCDYDGFLTFLIELAQKNDLEFLVIKETYRAEREWENVELLEHVADGPAPRRRDHAAPLRRRRLDPAFLSLVARDSGAGDPVLGS